MACLGQRTGESLVNDERRLKKPCIGRIEASVDKKQPVHHANHLPKKAGLPKDPI